ncbi:hypothetical protein C1Y40_01447 [Mycobacterium talmoniae]|uniref:Uncharacterized protein n=1 Tax=Mycobacterium talmoniae TaxID=1858794 RepID=A0A2S8BNW6_9MYCO|nr:hypothetical protein C1Y40_01447 [Mycobacterium talmoniae]
MTALSAEPSTTTTLSGWASAYSAKLDCPKKPVSTGVPAWLTRGAPSGRTPSAFNSVLRSQ